MLLEEDKIDLRTGVLLNNEEDKVDNGRAITINVIGSLPILAGNFMDKISSEDGKKYGLIDSIETETEASKAETKNFLFDNTKDEEGNLVHPDRYVYLGRGTSLISVLSVSIYYDELFKDIIIIPDLYSFGVEPDNVDLYEGNNITIEALNISGLDVTSRPSKDIVVPLNSNGIAKPKRFTKTKTLLATSFGLTNNSICGDRINVSDVNGSDTYVSSSKTAPLQYLEFQDNSELYDENPTLEIANLVQQTIGNGLSVDVIGRRKINKIIVPLNF